MNSKRQVRVSAIGAGLSLFIAAPAIMISFGGCSSGSAVDLSRAAPEDIELAKQISVDEIVMRTGGGPAAKEDLVVRSVVIDELAMGHARIQQKHRGVSVFGGEAIVHLNRDGSVDDVTSDLVRGIDTTLKTEPTLLSEAAISRAVADHGGADVLTEAPQAELFVLRQERNDRLVYRVELHREDGTEKTSIPIVFIDAHTGEKVMEYDNLQTASGTSLYSGAVSITTSKSGSTNYMEDLTRKVGTFDMRNGTSSVYRFTDSDDVWNSATQKAGVDAHYGAAATYDYFKNVHGRTGIDGVGGPGYVAAAVSPAPKLISSLVHYGTNYNNAFWNGTYMTYGDGDNGTFKPLVTLDIAGHEMTHGITEKTAKLVYSGESGALNEAMSDIFGAMIERSKKGDTNMWKIGEECFTPNTAGDALRYMDTPHLAANSGYTTDDDPDHYTERYTGTADSGGVHINSGIVNKMFHLLAAGGTHHKGGSMVGIGPDKAAAIVYRALTLHMTSTTNFAGARTAMESAANTLYGSTSAEKLAASKAWFLVGVGTDPGGGGGGSSSSSSSSSSSGGGSSCAHSSCVSGTALADNCNACVGVVCDSDAYCCTTAWDSQCVSEANSWCSGGCTP